MKNQIVKSALIVFCFALAEMTQASAPQNVRATQLTSKLISNLENGSVQDLIVEFRQGDRLPLTFQSEGDLLETNQTTPNFVVVKRPFWVRITKNQFMISLDGLNYKNLKDVLAGSLTATASDEGAVSGTANAISLILKAYLKN